MAPPFFPQRKGGRSVRGQSPLNPRAALSIFFSGKSTRTILPKPTRIKREPRGPRGPVGRGTENMWRPKNPGPQPLFLSLVFMISRGRFSSKENRQDHLGSGGIPQRRFCFLLSPRTKGSGRALDSFFARIAFFMRGQTMKPFFYMRSCRAAPPFLTSRKGGKKRQGAKPPEPPGGLVDFLLMKIDSNAATRTGQYNEGARLGAGLKQYSGPNPRGRSPSFYRRFL